MRASYGLNRLLKKAEGLERKVEYDIKKTGTTSIETYKNRCLGYIERLGMLTNVSKQDKGVAARKMYKIYFNLQDYEGGEKESDMEVSLESLLPELDLAIVEAYSADLRSGGLGFSSTNGLMLAEGLSAPKDPYWSLENSVKTQAPIRDVYYTYKGKPTMADHRAEMRRQKEEVLRGSV